MAARPAPAVDPDDLPLQPADALRTIAAQQRAVASWDVPSHYILFAWGTAWLIGYGAIAITTGPDMSAATWAYVLFAGALATALVATIVITARAVRGLRGRTSRIGAVYGLTWFASMATAMVLTSRTGAYLDLIGTPQATELGNTLSSALPCLVVGTMFMTGALIWDEVDMAWLGGWILVMTVVATLVGLPTGWWVMSLLGGGAMLVWGVVSLLRRRRAGRGVA